MAEQIKESENEHWMNSKWRPAMGWMYMIICMMDMVVFPILWSLLQAFTHGSVSSQWNPLTLQGAGLFHIAMGAVLGIAAFGRTQEKLGNASIVSTTVTSSAPVVQPATKITVPQSQQPQVIMINGKPAPQPAPQPEI
jgi:hypothetical protein